MPTPKPFTLRVSDEDIEDLRARLARTRFPDQAPDRPWAYGADLDYLRDLVPYWRDRFDWRAQEAKLNAFPQFMVPLHGIDLHLSLSRLNHRLPRGQAKPKIMQRTADFHHPIADALLPQPQPVFDNATALDTTVDMLDPKTALIHRPICVLLIRR